MKLFGKRGIKRALFTVFTLLLVLIIASPFILNFAVNTTYVKKRVTLAISQKTGADFNASKFSISLFPEPCVNIENFIFQLDAQRTIIIKAIKFNLDLQKILSGKINITHISVIAPEIKTSTSKAVQSIASVDVSDPKFIIQFSRAIKNFFTLLPEHQESVEFEFRDAKTAYFKKMDGTFYLSKEKSQIVFNSVIDKVALKKSEICNSECSKNFNIDSIIIDQINCTVTITSRGDIEGQCQLEGLKLNSGREQILCDSNKIDISFKSSGKTSENISYIDIKPFKLNYPEAVIKASFSNNQTLKKSLLNIRGTNIDVEQVRHVSLLLFKNSKIVNSIFEILRKGIVPKINISFHGKEINELFNENSLKLKGNIKNGVVKIPGVNLTASMISGNAAINSGILDIKIDKATLQGADINKANLMVALVNYVDFPFHGEFNLEIDLAKLSQTLISLLPDTPLSKELSSFHDVTGKTDAQLHLAMETQSDELKIRVHADDFSISGLYSQNVAISGDNTANNLSERLPDSSEDSWIFPLKAAGGNFYVASFDLTGSSSFGPESSDLFGPSGSNPSASSPSGSSSDRDTWQYDLKGRCTNVNISTYHNQKEVENLSCTYHISDKILDVNEIEATINNLSWLAPYADKKYIKNIVVPFDIDNAQLQIKPETSLLSGNIKFHSNAELDIELKGKTFESLYSTSIKLYDPDNSRGSVTISDKQGKPLFKFKGYLKTSTLDKLIKQESLWAKKLTALTQGNPVLIEVDDNSDLNITSKTVNLNLLDLHSKKSSIDYDYDMLAFKTINFKTEQLKINNFDFTNVASKIFLKQDGLYIKLNKAFLCNLEAKGYINIKKDSVNFKIPVKADNQTNIDNLLSCLFQKNRFMDGEYSLSSNLVSNGSKKNFLKKIKGSVEFTAKKGRIYKLTLLSRILSVVNVSKFFKGNIPNIVQQGFGYKKIIVEADIKESIIYLKKAIIDGEDMALIFKGQIDPLNDTIDLTCLVAPFKTIDLIIKKIPIVNTMLEGRLVSIPTKISGKLSDPAVIPLHPSAVGKGLVNMMTNILKTPVKLLESIDGE